MDAILGYFADDCVSDLPRGSSQWGMRFNGKALVREGLAGSQI